MKSDKLMKLQNGSDVRGIAADGVEGEKVLSPFEALEILYGQSSF